ncbi:uncharacterized protein ARMOST_22138 [Armillaria ostoyae]|uniref:Uncharacterized protein n=1 Tax=Armillaria ostoyae TaxID=47428 RepID=A0A284SC13_ARMOS|nr:uncharacterized protein ARMOST_22138 [Armillaria ostoyae]
MLHMLQHRYQRQDERSYLYQVQRYQHCSSITNDDPDSTREASSCSSTANNGNNAARNTSSHSSIVETRQATAALLLAPTLLATVKMPPALALAATSLPSSMSPLAPMPPITITLTPTIVSMAYEAMAAELFANDDHLMDEGSQDNEETDATQPSSSPSSHESGRSWENIEESDTHTERRNVRKPFKADKSLVIVKQEVDEIVPPKASGSSGLHTSPAKKERSSGLGAMNPSPRKERSSGEDHDEYFEVTVAGPHDQRLKLKARRRYQIRKVLRGACKSFRISFETARLIHIVKFVEDSTESVEQFKCDNDDTTAYGSIKEYAQLIVIQQEEDKRVDDEE